MSSELRDVQGAPGQHVAAQAHGTPPAAVAAAAHELQNLMAAVLQEVASLRQQLGRKAVKGALGERLAHVEAAACQASDIARALTVAGLPVAGPAASGQRAPASAPATERAPAATDVERPVSEVTGERATILVIEDGAAERRTLCKMLRQLGFQVLEAADGREAVKLFADHQADVALVVLDMLLPNLGGREAFRWLRRVDPAVRVLLTSGHLDPERVQDALFEGAVGFLQKPIGQDELRQVLHRALGARRSLS